MKILLLLFTTTQIVFGQIETEKPVRFVFKMSPQHLTLNMLKIGGEVFSKTGGTSYQFMLQAASNNRNSNAFGNSFDYNGGGLELTYKKYLSPLQEITTRKGRQFMQGIYFGGFIQGGLYGGDHSYYEWSWDDQTQTNIRTEYNYSTKAKNMAGGFMIGIQRIYWKVLSLDAFIGAGYQVGHQKFTGNPTEWASYVYDFTEPHYYGILPKFGLNIGLKL